MARLFDSHPELSLYPCDISLLYAYFPKFTSSNLSHKELRDRLSLVLRNSLEQAHRESNAGAISLAEISLLVAQVNEKLSHSQLCSVADVLKAVFSSWRDLKQLEDTTRLVVKETSQAIHYDRLKEALPDYKFLHVVRDPRDNYAAIKAGVAKRYSMRGEGLRETLASSMNRMRFDFRSAHLRQDRNPEDFMIVRFEDIVQKTEAEMHRVCDFFGIRFCESLLTPTLYGADYHGNNHDGITFNGVSSFNVGRWNERITRDEASVIEFWLSEEMQNFGYELANPEGEGTKAVSKFYDWYNTKYFFHDSF